MKILIVDNRTKHLAKIRNKLENHKVIINNPDEILEDKYNAIILTGGSIRCVKYNLEYYKTEMELILNTNTPILGVCLGFELICQTFNEKLERLEKKDLGFKHIDVQTKHWITNELDEKTLVYEAHKWIVQKTIFLKSLAKSNKGVEIIKHPTKEIYGVQFHPELSETKTIELFLERIKK